MGGGVEFFNIETLLSLLFYFLIGERITEKEGLETFIKRDYKVYAVRHYITSEPFIPQRGPCEHCSGCVLIPAERNLSHWKSVPPDVRSTHRYEQTQSCRVSPEHKNVARRF
jgi:hypothetical protein